MILTASNTFELDCSRCNGSGIDPSDATVRCAWCALNEFARKQKWERCLPILADNIAIVAFGCAAFRQGAKYADDLWDVDKHATLWRPGCGRSAP